MLATGLILAAVCVILSIYGASGQTSNLVLIYIIDNHIIIAVIYCQTAPQLMLSDCTTQMVTSPLRGVCCRSVGQAHGRQFVTSALAVPMKEKLLVDNLDIVEAKLVSA